LVTAPKSAQITRPELLAPQTVALANDAIAVVDRANPKSISRHHTMFLILVDIVLFDANTGKPINEKPLAHKADIVEINFEQTSNTSDRLLSIIDRNRDLYITPMRNPNFVKIGSMCDSAKWHHTTGMLAAMMDRQFVVWYYPNVVHIDRELLSVTKLTKDARCDEF